MPPGKTSRRAASNGFAETKGAAAPKAGAPRSASRTVRLADRATRWVVLAAVFLVAVLLAAPVRVRSRVEAVRFGKAVENVVATVTFSVPDVPERERQEGEVRKRSRFYYKYDKSVGPRVRRQIQDLFGKAGSLRAAGPDRSAGELATGLARWSIEKLGVDIGGDLASEILAQTEGEKTGAALDTLLQAIYGAHGVVEDLRSYNEREGQRRAVLSAPRGVNLSPADMLDVRELGDFVEDQMQRENVLPGLSSEEQAFVVRAARRFALPNVAFLAEKTQERLDAEIAGLNPVILIREGSILVPKGAPVGAEEEDLIERMRQADRQALPKRLTAIALVIALLCGLVFYYLRQFRSDIGFNTQNVLLVSLPVLFALALGRLSLETIRFADAAPYLFPAGLIGMLCVILLDARAAILLVTVGSLVFAISTGLDFKVFLTSLMGGYAAVTTLTTVKERRAILGAGLVVGVVNAAAISLVNFIDDPRALRFDLMLSGVFNGLACGIMAWSTLVPFESWFGVVTDIRLLELTGLDHPLLKELEEKVPGSYQHSLSVCKLSEAAARAIGANYLLVRAGAYYHDIGKTLKPAYFGENQITLEEKSLHGRISPYMSAMVIKNHVKAGIDLARQYRLPQRVIDFIPEHHGTTIISYFHHEALKRYENSQSADPVREDDFRYPGPKPQSVETAIVMVADTVEATVTSRFTSLSVNEDELRVVVQKNISDRFNDGQFDECDLTLRDLHLIRESFVKTLLGRFHHRIKYPSKPSLSGPAAPTAARDRMERIEA